jgi:type IV secretory pathway TraG/TraD family ATPase VirD4
LLLPEEVRQFGAEEALVFQEGVRAVRGAKIRYYRDRAFAHRRGVPPAEVPKLEIVSRPVPRFTEFVEPAVGATPGIPGAAKVDAAGC